MTLCKNCHTQNSPIATRCAACASPLDHVSGKDPEAYRRAAFWVDARMLSGIGAAAGFGLSWALLKFIMAGLGIYLDPRQRFLLSTVLVAVGVFFAACVWPAGRPPGTHRRRDGELRRPLRIGKIRGNGTGKRFSSFSPSSRNQYRTFGAGRPRPGCGRSHRGSGPPNVDGCTVSKGGR